jgi:hypothetical protein
MKKSRKNQELETMVDNLTDEVDGLSQEVADVLKEKTKPFQSSSKDENRRLPYLAHQDSETVHRFINFREK